jgi:hypothetical protein
MVDALTRRGVTKRERDPGERWLFKNIVRKLNEKSARKMPVRTRQTGCEAKRKHRMHSFVSAGSFKKKIPCDTFLFCLHFTQ